MQYYLNKLPTKNVPSGDFRPITGELDILTPAIFRPNIEQNVS